MRAAYLALSIAFSLLVAVAPATPRPDGVRDPHAVVRGMTVSCHGSGHIWGTDDMVACLAELKSLGVNWVAIHPYAGIGEDGTVGGARTDAMYRDAAWLTRPIAEAHRLGLKIMIKPHIAYWGSKFSWRGEIRFETDEQWERFFTTYERWITTVAEIARDADALAVGTELDATVHHERQWRAVIRAIRARTGAHLTYAANWDSYERVPFWDALDIIGVQCYFPLVDHERLPDPAELQRGWRRVIDTLHAFARPFGKKVILAELGYNESSKAALEPWDHRTGGPDAVETQRRCMAEALRAIEGDPVIVGAFLWKWFPEGAAGGDRRGRGGRGNFLMSTPDMREIIAARWSMARPPADTN